MPILYLHGLGQTPAAWSKTLAHLPQTHVTVCPNLTSYLTLSGEPATYDALYRAFCDGCEDIEKPFSICGLSLGAVVALHYAIEHPENVSAMVLAAPQYAPSETLLKIQNFFFRLMPDRSFAKMGLTKANAISLMSSMSSLDFTKDLARVTCPVSVVCGAMDGANHNAAVKLAKLLPNAEFVSLVTAGHEVNVDTPDHFAEVIRKRLYQI